GDSYPMQVDTLVAPRAAGESAVPVVATDEATRMVVRPTVRVEIRRVDRLITLVGELRGSLGELPAAAEARLAELERLTLQMRMVPLASLFDKLARLVRTIAREAGKEIELHVDG